MVLFLTYLSVGLLVLSLGPAMADALVNLHKNGARYIWGFILVFVIGGLQLVIAALYHLYRTIPPNFEYRDLLFYVVLILISSLVAETVVIICCFYSYISTQRIIITHPITT
jgi:glycerol uptake facilitator-like aquaporin